jgi:hypothetical protein
VQNRESRSMNLQRRFLLQAFVVCAALPLVACQRNVNGRLKDKIMEKFQMNTYAVGRFLIDLPDVVKDIAMSQKIFGTKIEWKPATEAQYLTLLSMRVNELTGTNPESQLLIGYESGEVLKSHIISFEKEDTRDGFVGYEGYRYADEVHGYFLLTGSAARKKIANITPSVNEVLKLFQPRLIDPGIRDRGICIDHAFVSGADSEWGERTGIMASLDNIRIGFSTQVIERIDEGPSLLQRAEVAKAFPEAKILRKTKRDIAGLKGAELSFMDTPQASSAYSLQWEYQGQPNSIAAPRIEASIDTTGPMSISEEQLLGLWDTILGSIRMRPGAV